MHAPDVKANFLHELHHSPRHHAGMHDADDAIGNPHCNVGTSEPSGQDNLYTCVSGDLTA